jgi:hypothetical protein
VAVRTFEAHAERGNGPEGEEMAQYEWFTLFFLISLVFSIFKFFFQIRF